MTEPSKFTKAQWAMQDAVDMLNKAFTARESQLQKMPMNQLRALGNDYLLPQDLNKTQLIKYIIQKEFHVR